MSLIVKNRLNMREECDSLGKLIVPDEAVYGIHTLRALDNFPVTGERINLYLIKAYFLVKRPPLKQTIN